MYWLFTNKINRQIICGVQRKTEFAIKSNNNSNNNASTTQIIYDEEKDREETYAKAYKLDDEKRKRKYHECK